MNFTVCYMKTVYGDVERSVTLTRDIMHNKWINFLERHLGKHEIAGLSDEMEIEGDLAISGEDGYEFFEDFCTTFNIKTNGNKADDFFHPEPSFDIFNLLFLKRDVGQKARILRILIFHRVNCHSF